MNNKKHISNEIVQEVSKESVVDKKSKILELNDIHIEILEMVKKNDYTIWENELNCFYKPNTDNEIAFTELVEYGYIKDTQVISKDKGCGHMLNNSKKIEVLKK